MYAVDWELSASNEFAVICMLHADRWNDINAADNEIEKKLRRNPVKHGQPLSEGLLRIVFSPLAVFFSIDGTQVHVEAVGWIG